MFIEDILTKHQPDSSGGPNSAPRESKGPVLLFLLHISLWKSWPHGHRPPVHTGHSSRVSGWERGLAKMTPQESGFRIWTSFLGDLVTNYHKFSVLKQKELILSRLWRAEVKIKVLARLVPPGSSEGESIPWVPSFLWLPQSWHPLACR